MLAVFVPICVDIKPGYRSRQCKTKLTIIVKIKFASNIAFFLDAFPTLHIPLLRFLRRPLPTS